MKKNDIRQTFIAFHVYPQWGDLSSFSYFFAGSCFLLSRKGSTLSSIPISSSMPRIIYPLSAMMNISGIFSLVFKNPDSLVSSTSEIEPTNKHRRYVWDGTIRCTCHKKLGSIVVLVLTHVNGCKFSLRVFLWHFTTVYNGICVGIQLSERVRKCSSYLFYCRYPINLPQVVIKKAYPGGYAMRHHTWTVWNEMLNLLT